MSVVDMVLLDKHLELKKDKKKNQRTSIHDLKVVFLGRLLKSPWEDSVGTEPAFLYEKLGFCS